MTGMQLTELDPQSQKTLHFKDEGLGGQWHLVLQTLDIAVELMFTGSLELLSVF